MGIYYSKVDWWLIAVIVGSVLFTFALGIFIGGLFLLLAVPCKYTLTEDRVIIQSGILRQEALYSQITGVKKNNNPLSAPALSLQRVKIMMTNGFKLISPKNREQFIEELISKLPVTP